MKRSALLGLLVLALAGCSTIGHMVDSTTSAIGNLFSSETPSAEKPVPSGFPKEPAGSTPGASAPSVAPPASAALPAQGGSSKVPEGNVSDTAGVKDWHPAYLHRINQKLPQIIGVVKKTGKVGRVDANLVARQIGNLGIPFEPTKEGLLALLQSSKVEVVPCTSELLKQYYLSRTNKGGTKFDFEWQRSECYKGEELVVYKFDDGRKQAILSLGCGNVMTPKQWQAPPPASPPPHPPAAKLTPGGCSGLTLYGYPWKGNSFPSSLREEVDKIYSKESFDGKYSLSRFMGGTLRALAEVGSIQFSSMPYTITMSSFVDGEWRQFGIYTTYGGRVAIKVPDNAMSREMEAVITGGALASPPHRSRGYVLRMTLDELRPPKPGECERYFHFVEAWDGWIPPTERGASSQKENRAAVPPAGAGAPSAGTDVKSDAQKTPTEKAPEGMVRIGL